MNIQEFYRYIGGDYEDALRRFINETLIRKFALSFLTDQSYIQLKQAIREKNQEQMFRGAHNLKGVCANLSFAHLYRLSSELTDQLRGADAEIDLTLVEKVDQEYEKIIKGLEQVGSNEQ